MTERWEYLQLDWSYTLIVKGKTPAGRTAHAWKGEIEIFRPGQAQETLLAHDSEDPKAETVTVFDLLNELGGEGWELVAETILDSVVSGSRNGWTDVGTPVKARWTLKRRIAS